MLKAFVKSHFDVPIHLLWLLLASLFFQFSAIKCAILPADDEFSEFEDPDDTFTVDLSESTSRGIKRPNLEPPDPKETAEDDIENESIEAKPTSSETDSVDEDIPIIHRKPLRTNDAVEQEDDSDVVITSDEFEDVPFREDEEFEGIVPAPSSIDSQQTQGKRGRPELQVAKVPHHLSRSWDSYQMEMIFISVLAVYLCNYLVGRTKNIQLASAWFEAHKPILDTQFALVGDDGLSESESGSGTLLKECEHLYSLWCSGRASCEAMFVELRLLRRQCLAFSLANWLRPACDTIVAKVIMDDAEMDGWVMAVGRKRRLQTLVKDHQDLAFFCPDKRGQRHPGLPDSMTVLSEIPEATTAMLNGPICKFIMENEDSIDYLFFSDQYTGPKPPPDDTVPVKIPVTQKVLIFAFRVGNKGSVTVENMQATVPLFQFIFYTIDKVRRIRLGKESKAKSERNRQRSYEAKMKALHSQRQEAAQSRREERVRANKERIMAEEDPDKARKLEEREQRKEKAKRMPKMKMLKTKGM